VGRYAYTFQFHVELDSVFAAAWTSHLPSLVRLDEERRAEVERVGRAVIARFLDRAGTC
jgi:hypothetical protein